MARSKREEPVEDWPIRLSSKVTVVVRCSAAIYDTLGIQQVGGAVTVGLNGATAPNVMYQAAPTGEYVPPAGTPNLDKARAALEAQFPSGPAAHVATQRDVVSPVSLGLPSAEELGLLGGGAGEFAGRSNEDTDA